MRCLSLILLLSAASVGSAKHAPSGWLKPSSSVNKLNEATKSALLVNGGAKARKPKKGRKVTVSSDGASMPSLVFNLVKGIVGVGVLSLPAGISAFADSKSAILPAITMISIIGILSGYGFAIIGKVCAYTGSSSYREAWAKSVGPNTAWIPAWSATLKTSLACLAFSMVLGDTFASLLGTPRIPTLLGMTCLILLPLCLMKNLKSLAPFSLLGVLGMGYTALAMTVRWLDGTYAMSQQFGLVASGSLVKDVAESARPLFGSIGGFKSALSPKSLILLCMLSTAYMVRIHQIQELSIFSLF